jgi:tRNA modification GTPase
LQELKEAVAELLQTAKLNPADGILFTERQRDAARQAGECVSEALMAVETGVTLDAVTVSVEGAISALLELTGERATEAVVDSVFSHFCVGK